MHIDVAPLADVWWDWKQDQDAEAVLLEKQETEATAEEESLGEK
ncbi:hypothetical protein [Bacillus swezeyi]|nr:hypothetical protein [Bacillus swezeyi]